MFNASHDGYRIEAVYYNDRRDIRVALLVATAPMTHPYRVISGNFRGDVRVMQSHDDIESARRHFGTVAHAEIDLFENEGEAEQSN